MTIQSFLRVLVMAALVTLTGSFAACSDDFFQLNWSADVDTTLIYSLDRPEINLPSAFDFVMRELIEIHQPGTNGQWDILLDTEDGQLMMKVPAFFGLDSDARISVFSNMDFDDVLRAPEDTTDFTADPVRVEPGNVYVIQTHLAPDRFQQSCHFFAKMQPLTVDVENGTMRFVFDRNPLCEDLDLVPEMDQ